MSGELRPLQNGRHIKLLDPGLAAELASFAEPVMQLRYGEHTEVHLIDCDCPERSLDTRELETHQAKARSLVEKFVARNAPRSSATKLQLGKLSAEVLPFPNVGEKV